MAHEIYVCLEHKRLMHGERNKGIHANHHHDKRASQLEEEGIIIHIGTCENSMWFPCKDSHDRDATEQEIKQALSMKNKQIQ
jgi:hypothetical protein